MLDDTLVIWGGEFGRTPMAQGNGRDHHIKGFSMWLAGGGIKGGITYGATDELGYNAVEDVVHVHDLHATMLHLLGIDHTRFTYRFQGRLPPDRRPRPRRAGDPGVVDSRYWPSQVTWLFQSTNAPLGLSRQAQTCSSKNGAARP